MLAWRWLVMGEEVDLNTKSSFNKLGIDREGEKEGH